MSWQAAVDERMIARLEAHERRGERLTRDWSVSSSLREPRSHVEPSDWRAGYLRADRERDVPPELQADLRQNMPQALLRDLYRTVHEDRWVQREIVEGTGDRVGREAMQVAREARRLPSLPRVEPAVRAVLEHQRWRRALLASPWQPVKR